MKFSKFIMALTGAFLGITALLQAQSIPNQGELGLRANINGQSTIEIPYMLNESLSIAPYLGISATENQFTDINIGIRPRYYMGLENSFSPYFTGILGFSNRSFSNANSSNSNLNFGVGYGIEYFFSNNFSISGDANLISRFGNDPTQIQTSAQISATFYF